jgi:hypothetical protein
MQGSMVERKPIARFFYQGSHTHPIRRTVLLLKETADSFTGYELRAGRTVRALNQAPVKTYRKVDIARYCDYSRLRQTAKARLISEKKSTLIRKGWGDLIRSGA